MAVSVLNRWVHVQTTGNATFDTAASPAQSGDYFLLLDAGNYAAAGDRITSVSGLGATWTKVANSDNAQVFAWWIGTTPTETSGTVTATGPTLSTTTNRCPTLFHIRGESGTVIATSSQAANGSLTSASMTVGSTDAVLVSGYSDNAADVITALNPATDWTEHTPVDIHGGNRYYGTALRYPPASASHSVTATRASGVVAVTQVVLSATATPTDRRVSQVAAKALVQPDTVNRRISQEAAKVLVQPDAVPRRVSQQAIKVLVREISAIPPSATLSATATLTATLRRPDSPYTAEVRSDNPYGLWMLDEWSGTTFEDWLGSDRQASIVGTPTAYRSASVAPGLPPALSLDGQYLNIPYDSSLSGDSLTTEAWIVPTNMAAGTPRGMFQFGTSGDGDALLPRIGDAGLGLGDVQVWLRTVSGNAARSVPGALPANNQPYHLVTSYDATSGTARVYVNGAFIGQMTGWSGNFSSSATTLRVPYNWDSSRSLRGRFSALAIYRGVLSPERVAAHYDAGMGVVPAVPLTASLSASTDLVGSLRLPAPFRASLSASGTLAAVLAEPPPVHAYTAEVLADAPLAYWKLDEVSGSFVDSSGNAKTLTISGGVTRGTAGAPDGTGVGVTLDGTSGYLTSNQPINHSDFSIELWYKGTDGQGGLATARNTASLTSITMGLGKPPVGGDNVGGRVNIGIDGNGKWRGIQTTSVVVNDNAWHHIVGVWDGTSGVNIEPAQFKIYVDGVQTATQNTVYTTQAAPVNSGGGVYTFGGPSGAWPTNGFLTGSVDEIALYATPLSAARVTAHHGAALKNPAMEASLGASASLTARMTTPGVPYSTEVLADAPAGYWRLAEEASGTTMVDSSGSSRNGTYTGTLALATPGLLATDANTAVDFDGGYGQVAYNSAWMAATSFTVEFLMRLDATNTESWVVARHGNGAPSWGVTLTGTTLGFTFYGGPWHALTLPTAIEVGRVYHIACTYDGTTRRIYVDGVLAASDTRTPFAASSAPLSIGHLAGAYAGAGYSFKGVLDEVAFYPKELPAHRIAGHYEAATTTIPTTTVLAASLSASTGLAGLLRLPVPLKASLSASASLIGTMAGPTLLKATLSAQSSLLAPLWAATPLRAALSAATELLGSLTVHIPLPWEPEVDLIEFSGSGELTVDAVIHKTITTPVAFTGEGDLSVQRYGPRVVRWKFTDKWSGDSWRVPINPNEMNSPHPAKSMKYAYGVYQGHHRARGFQLPSEIVNWEFGGVIHTKEHHDKLLEWAEKGDEIQISDHLGRTFEVIVQEYMPEDRRPRQWYSNNLSDDRRWRMKYRMRVLLLRRVS